MTPQDPKTRAKELVDAHWQYVKATITVHLQGMSVEYTPAEVLAIVEHHYLTAAVHFHGHGVEDERNRLFYPRIGEPLTKEQIASVTGSIPSIKEWEAAGVKRAEDRLPPDLTPIATPGPYPDITLPLIALDCTLAEADKKCHEEWEEFLAATDPLHKAIEAWDYVHAVQTYKAKGGIERPDPITFECLSDEQTAPLRHQALRAMLCKNAARWMYSDEVNSAILASNGHSWTVKGE